MHYRCSDEIVKLQIHQVCEEYIKTLLQKQGSSGKAKAKLVLIAVFQFVLNLVAVGVSL
jgi:hypothetical protein